ncbi:hypothetical protein FRC09_017259 [Ceratobasidium sp. 395]|nr:hypothetical protein FRC09_017259 [Ceratobasidium sp. 395]
MTITTPIDDPNWSLGGFQYFGAWDLGESIPQHYGGTATYSNAPGSKAVLFFSGTSIVYYADRQQDLGIAKVSIDGLTADAVNLTSTKQQYRQAVWSKNFADGDHQLTIEHAGTQLTKIMIDYVSIESNAAPVSGSAGPIASVVPSNASLIDSSDPQLGFSGDWRVETEGLFYNNSRQATQSPGSSLRLTFNGTAIWYFSNMGPEYGNIRIGIDSDQAGQSASAYSPNSLAQKLIWSKTDLSVGTHSITITHDDSSGKYAAIDFFRYVASAGSSGNTNPNSSGSSDTGSENYSKKPPIGAIVGGTVGGLFLIAALLLCLFFRRRRRPRSQPPPSTANVPAYSATAFSHDKPSSTESITTPSHPMTPNHLAATNQQHMNAMLPLGQTIPRGYVMPSNPVSELYPDAIRAAGHMAGYDPTGQGQPANYAPAAVAIDRNLSGGYDAPASSTAAETYRDKVIASRVDTFSPLPVAEAGASLKSEPEPIQASPTRGASIARSAPPDYDKK